MHVSLKTYYSAEAGGQGGGGQIVIAFSTHNFWNNKPALCKKRETQITARYSTISLCYRLIKIFIIRKIALIC